MRLTVLVMVIATCVALGSGDTQAEEGPGIDAFRKGDFEAALVALEPRARAGDAEAQYYLAEMYLRGNGVSQDFVRAKDWYEKSAESGLPAAQAALAGLNLLGLGTDRDYQTGYFWTVISVIWSSDDIRKAGMRSLTQVSRMLEANDKVAIVRDAGAAWRQR